ncbi:MAG: hypothetical protein WBA13_10775 [Microcoleaceae cyanobacterium]
MLNITNSVKGLALTASTVVLSLGIVGTTSAQASNNVFWDIEFLDQSGVVVGNGEFSYDLSTTTLITADIESPLVPPGGFEVQTALEVESFSIFGQEVRSFSTATWWFESEFDIGQQFRNRDGEFSVEFGSWVFLDNPRFGESILRMNNFELISETLAGGNWNAGAFNFPNLFGGGEWTATLQSQSVPEPTATLSLLAFSALGVASMLKRKN